MGFAASVADWAGKTEEIQTEVLHEALRGLVGEVTRPKSEGGNLPKVTGNLGHSVAVSALGLVAYEWGTKKFRDPSDAVNNAIAGVAVGQTAWIGFRAPYAHKIEVENGFVRLAAQRWPQIVAEAVRASNGGRGR